ncbi:uncharacterized protein N7446_007330 [Penicillium canescens]|uniref:uncharacterized protein n=1 Tax=Penicillium canescens TaxID=5083 RepID=UPI0026E0ABA5|nr:uncharacterized protein N7446_007330 [Penicillium canescens]KAJ6063210.1 hypothetical protein N7446_007330 [Penicillium canescens]
MQPFIFVCAIIASMAMTAPTDSAGGVVLDKRQVADRCSEWHQHAPASFITILIEVEKVFLYLRANAETIL